MYWQFHLIIVWDDMSAEHSYPTQLLSQNCAVKGWLRLIGVLLSVYTGDNNSSETEPKVSEVPIRHNEVSPDLHATGALSGVN